MGLWERLEALGAPGRSRERIRASGSLWKPLRVSRPHLVLPGSMDGGQKRGWVGMYGHALNPKRKEPGWHAALSGTWVGEKECLCKEDRSLDMLNKRGINTDTPPPRSL